MTANQKIAAAVAALVVIGAGVVVYATTNDGEDTPSPSPVTSTASTPKATAASQSQTSAVEVTYTSSGFNPKSVTVKSGQPVIFKNASSVTLEVASDPHPSHTILPALNLGSIPAGGTKTVTLTKMGSFGFHNHLKPSDTGTIVVQ